MLNRTATPARGRRRLAAIAAAGALALVPITAASAATVITLDHDVNGSTYIRSIKSSAKLGPGTLLTELDADTGDFTGKLTLPDTRTKFAVFGAIPIEADISFVPAGPVKGHINLADEKATVAATAKFYVTLSNVTLLGFLPLVWDGAACQTVDPVSIPVNTPAGEGFDLTNGGRLAGTYSIGEFENCGLFITPFVNALVPGSGNTVSLQATNG